MSVSSHPSATVTVNIYVPPGDRLHGKFELILNINPSLASAPLRSSSSSTDDNADEENGRAKNSDFDWLNRFVPTGSNVEAGTGLASKLHARRHVDPVEERDSAGSDIEEPSSPVYSPRPHSANGGNIPPVLAGEVMSPEGEVESDTELEVQSNMEHEVGSNMGDHVDNSSQLEDNEGGAALGGPKLDLRLLAATSAGY